MAQALPRAKWVRLLVGWHGRLHRDSRRADIAASFAHAGGVGSIRRNVRRESRIRQTGGTSGSDSYALWLQNGTLRGPVGDTAGNGPLLSAPFSLAPGRWYHVAYTFDDGVKQQALYIDGAPVAIGAVTKSIGYDAQPLFLGRDTENGIPNFFLQGRIDEAAIYKRALIGAEIASIFNAGAAGKR